ncbi:MAG: S8 family peptidase [Mycobacterium leprae]
MDRKAGYAGSHLVLLHDEADLYATLGQFHHHGAHRVIPVPFIHGFLCLSDEVGVQALGLHPAVASVEEDRKVKLVSYERSNQVQPEGVQWLRAPAAWAYSRGSGVGVAVLDTGIDLAHPDLSANIAGGINFVSPGRPPQDDHGHGTHVAGTIGALDNRVGVVGVAPNCKLYAVKVLDATGGGMLSNVILGLQWAVTHQLPLANLSVGTTEESEALARAVRGAAATGMTLVAAAGNTGEPGSVLYPARYPEVIAVSAVGGDGKTASFSSVGPEVDLAAPGVAVLSTLPRRRYGRFSGTSMAAPHVTGSAALYLALHPGQDPRIVKRALLESAVPLAGLTPEEQGAGRVDALNMVLQSADE